MNGYVKCFDNNKTMPFDSNNEANNETENESNE